MTADESQRAISHQLPIPHSRFPIMWTFRKTADAEASQTGTVDAPIDLSRPLLSLRNLEKVY